MADWSIHQIAVKVIAVGAAALTVGGGTVLLNVNKDNAVQDQRIASLERVALKIDEMDKTLRIVDTKVDVLNQKLDDAKAELAGRTKQ